MIDDDLALARAQIKVESAKETVVKVDDIKPYALNSKIHSEENIRMLAASIAKSGMWQSMIVWKDLTLIAGHGRWEAIKLLGWKEVKVKIADTLTENEANQLRISLNKTASDEYDSDILAKELAELEVEDGDILALGFSEKEFTRMTHDMEAITVEAFTDDLDADIDTQMEESKQDVVKTDQKMIAVGKALGFDKVSIENSRLIGEFVGNLQDEYGLSPEESFIKFVMESIG